MRRILLTCLAATLLFTTPAFASIRCSIDNIYDTVSYRVTRRITSFSKATHLDVIKTVDINNNATYHAWVRFHQSRNKFVENRAEVVIDGVAYPIRKAIPREPIQQHFADAVGYFKIPVEVANKMADFKDDIVFQFYIKGEKQRTLSFGPKKNEELRLLATINYSDFEAVESRELKAEDDED